VTGEQHPCPAPGCVVRLPFEQFACRRHWFDLPPVIRGRLSRTWGSGDIGRYLAAREEAVRWLESPPAERT
jgi:hypothetical protein